MTGEYDQLKQHATDLERRVQRAEQKASYYQKLAERAGAARLKETETLSQLLTERSQIEEELQRHRDHLEELVNQRTAELSSVNEQLRQEIIERQRAEEEQRRLEANLRQTQKLEALGRLAGGIAHDFNNLLGIMMGHVEVLLQNFPEESQEQSYLDAVLRAGERAADLIRQILIFSRAQEHRLIPTDLAQILEETLSLIRATMPSFISIRSHIQPSCRPTLADASQIQQVIVNLCVNAQHAMQEQDGTLEVSLEECTYDIDTAQKQGLAAGTYLKLMVRDTGCGISPQVQERIFEPFFTTKEAGEGSGLGLAVVHGIVTGHHGAITIESDIGLGTTFSVFFPVVDASLRPDNRTMSRTRLEQGQGLILIVDDEPELVNLYESALTRLGYQVATCFNGDDALDKFRVNPDRFDLVFTDQVMPGLTGMQLSREILKIRADIPIILATGYSETITEQEAKDFGLRDFLLKPIKMRILIPVIRKTLGD